MLATKKLRSFIRAEVGRQVGRHDEPELYAGLPGDPGLVGGPGSVSWRLHADLASLAIAGPAAIAMEVLHPSVMAGVHAHSSYRVEPYRRARATLGYVLCTTFGSTPAARREIARVRGIHARIAGSRPDGVAYRALDPELIAWVHTCIPWMVMGAYERTCRRLSETEKNRYLSEQAVIGRLGGADWVPESVAELERYLEDMRPKLRLTEATRQLVAFMSGEGFSLRERLESTVALRASFTLLPSWAQRALGFPPPGRWATRAWVASDRNKARLLRWAIPELDCVAMAHARVASGDGARGTSTQPA